MRLLVTFMLLASGFAIGGETPNPSEIYVKEIQYSGNGCPSSSVAINVSDDGQAFTLLYDSFIVDLKKHGRRREWLSAVV